MDICSQRSSLFLFAVALRAAGLRSLLSAIEFKLWFGLRLAFGLEVTMLIQTGPYRLSRNPQLVGGALLAVAKVNLWQLWYAVGWIILSAAAGHFSSFFCSQAESMPAPPVPNANRWAA